MTTRAMIVVAAGSSTRFGGEKLMTELAGKPLIAHTISTVIATVHQCVLVGRHDMMEALESLAFDCDLVPGGPTRTASEMAGLAAVRRDADLIGIHDAARPGASPELVDALFHRAAAVGGAVPALAPSGFLIDRESREVLDGVVAVQTPQVFRADGLRDAYTRAAREGVTGHDTVDLVLRFSDTAITTVPGEPANLKVTYPTDIIRLEKALAGRTRT